MRDLRAAIGVAVLCAMASACAESSRTLNPTAPSAVVAEPLASTSNEVSTAAGGPKDDKGKPDNPGNGNGHNGNGNGNGNGGGGKPDTPGNGKPAEPGNPNTSAPAPDTTTPAPSTPVPSTPAPTAPGITSPSPAPDNTAPVKPGNPTPPGHIQNKVEIEGMIGAIDGSTITVNGQIVTVPASAVIRQGHTQYAFSELLVGDPVHVRATRTVTGSGASSTVSIEAVEVKLQREEDEAPDPVDPEEPVDPEAPAPATLVSVGALDASAAEAGFDTGTFRFSRSGDTAAELTVTIALTGTATNGADFANVSLTVTFAAGQATADVVITPLADVIDEASETVIVSVVDGDTYDVGSPSSATITIAG